MKTFRAEVIVSDFDGFWLVQSQINDFTHGLIVVEKTLDEYLASSKDCVPILTTRHDIF